MLARSLGFREQPIRYGKIPISLRLLLGPQFLRKIDFPGF